MRDGQLVAILNSTSWRVLSRYVGLEGKPGVGFVS